MKLFSTPGPYRFYKHSVYSVLDRDYGFESIDCGHCFFARSHSEQLIRAGYASGFSFGLSAYLIAKHFNLHD